MAKNDSPVVFNLLIDVFGEKQLFGQHLDVLPAVSERNAPEQTKDGESLPAGQIVEQRVKLRTVADNLVNLLAN